MQPDWLHFALFLRSFVGPKVGQDEQNRGKQQCRKECCRDAVGMP
ncbi:hypothetical protein IJ21_36940 [Paenibacillus sp. 32O-W]|nr:hypothetical protein IJ21_36940 [Paenibacillus sp. 32O-W]